MIALDVSVGVGSACSCTEEGQAVALFRRDMIHAQAWGRRVDSVASTERADDCGGMTRWRNA